MAEGGGKFVEYAGGYGDMLAQRGRGIAAKAAPKSSSKAAAAPREKPADAKRRMTFKDKHALEELPKKIAQAEAEIASLQEALSDADLYARDSKRFAALSEKLSRTRAELCEHEERWLTLEMLRAEIEGG
jgi:ATP-binding cassette subfamily F protein uup